MSLEFLGGDDIQYFYISIIEVLVTSIGIMLRAIQENGLLNSKDDIIFPRKKKLVRLPFSLKYITIPVRLRATIFRRFSQLEVVTYLLLILVGRIAYGSFEFVAKDVLLQNYGLFYILLFGLVDAGLTVYVSIKTRSK